MNSQAHYTDHASLQTQPRIFRGSPLPIPGVTGVQDQKEEGGGPSTHERLIWKAGVETAGPSQPLRRYHQVRFHREARQALLGRCQLISPMPQETRVSDAA